MAGKRSIFEDVTEAPRPPGPQGGLIAQDTGPARRAVRLWLAVLFVLVAAMIMVGGMTRLTDSGLSITEWRPVTGALPPMSAEDWQAEFDKYRESPQARLVNSSMTLGEFKVIFWWEWGHRQLGRLVGLVWAVGLAGLWAAGRVPAGWMPRLVLVGALGGVQGAIGWWMVHSGLQPGMTSVASYRLAVHLGLAFAILGLIAWYMLTLGRAETELLTARRGKEGKLFGLSTGLMHFTFLQILLGALVAGIDAGRGYPTWPLMNGQFFPADAFYVPDGQGGSLPVWHAFFENPGLVQFMHRMSGYLLLAFGVVVWLRGRRSAHGVTRAAFHIVMLLLAAQVVVGIYTALTAAHLHVAITHQVVAIVLWVMVIRARHLSLYPRAGSIRKGTA